MTLGVRETGVTDKIELHDSVVSFRIADGVLVLQFCPAYIHHWQRSPTGWRGEGRAQAAEITIARGSITPRPTDGVSEVSGGWFEVGGDLHQNIIPVPFQRTAPVRGWLELVNAEPVNLSGEGMVVRLTGEPEYVEDLPLAWAPTEDAP